MRLVSVVALLGLAAPTLASVNLISEQINTYKTIMSKMGHNDLTIDTLKAIYKMADSDSMCESETCENYLRSLLAHDGKSESSNWDFFEKLITALYAGQISFDPFQPQEIHLTLTPQPEVMKMMWATMQPLDAPYVEFMPAESRDWSAATHVVATNYTYRVEQKWWPIFTGVLYEADMSGLTAGQTYQYRVGGYDWVNKTDRYSEIFEFSAAPAPNPNRKTVAAVFGDHGTFEMLGFAVTNKMVEMFPSMKFEMVMVAGDLAYAGISSAFPPFNITKEDEFSHIWDLLMIQNQPIAARIPWMTGVGNHEHFYDWAAFTNRFHMPASTNSNGNFWYSYNFGNIHWISLSSEHSLDAGSPQKVFLEADLQAAADNRGAVPWIVVVMHRPLYCSIEGSPEFAPQLEPLLLQYDVDLTLTGHMHAYERVHPVNNAVVTVHPTKGRTAEDRLMDVYHSTGFGPVHVVQGNAGALQEEHFVQPQPEWSAIRMANGWVAPNRTSTDLNGVILPTNYTNTFGFGVINAINSTHLYYVSTPITGDIGYDHFWIVKRV